MSNRTIKFRGKRVDCGTWVYGNLCYYRFDENKEAKPCIHNGDLGCINNAFFQVQPDTVGQFTGLFDKNGKEIYEGDIQGVPEDSDFLHEIVIFEDGCFSVEDDYTSVTLNTVDTQYRTIVGNIHDNPDVL